MGGRRMHSGDRQRVEKTPAGDVARGDVSTERLVGGRGYLAQGTVNDCLPDVPAGSAALAVFSPRYLDLVDYQLAALGRDRTSWRRGPREALEDYLSEHRETVGHLAEALAPDATICLEIDEYRDPESRALVSLPDCWRTLLESAGFRIVEHIRLARTIALGRRSGHFVRYGGRPGYFLPDNVCSTLIVAQRGDPMARLRHVGRHEPSWATPVALAQPFLKNLWNVAPPPRMRGRNVRANQGVVMHPVPMDPRVAEACVRFFSVPGDHVLAPFAGSGTVAKAAAALGRFPICIEREPGFIELIRATVPLDWTSLTHVPRALQRPSVQLALPMGDTLTMAARQSYVERSGREAPTVRLQRMAQFASKVAGITVPPELLAACLIGERQYCEAHRR